MDVNISTSCPGSNSLERDFLSYQTFDLDLHDISVAFATKTVSDNLWRKSKRYSTTFLLLQLIDSVPVQASYIRVNGPRVTDPNISSIGEHQVNSFGTSLYEHN